MIRSIFVIFSLLGLGSAQLVQFGQCNPNIALQQNFNATRFAGLWYGIARTDNEYQNGDCAVLQMIQSGNIFNVTNEAVNNNFLEQITGDATIEQGTAKFTLRMAAVQNPVDFWILTTDYDNFAVGYACENRGNVQRNVYIWQLGRATSYPTEMMEALVNTTINNLLGINTSDLRRIDHSDNACYVLPPIPDNQSIILPGQCNPNMSVVGNFNAGRFAGVWHEISRYYTENQGGTCNRAQYTVADGGVNVLNSMVVNQRLETISGRAAVSSTDGSARLTVNLEVAPNVFSSAELWVLATDYDNYAVSYNCVNLENNTRRVRSWILSRNRQLSAISQQAVNQLIRTEIDLNDRFYQQTDQSDAGCFFFPDLVPGQPVVFRGQCDMNIRAMAAFQADRYMGLWHDIESYPSVFQGGTCNNANYTLTGGTVRVFNTQVINQRLDTIEGVAVVASDDGSAKLRVSFPIAGTNLTTSTDYWVLDTDYLSYSIVYSCTNINNEEREVYGWKLSRTKQLTAAGNTAINAAINNIQVLDQRYFVTRDQSAAGCFYFPEPQANVPVVFPGQCDQNVPVVSGFSMQQFAGVWYEIEAYPKEQQTGQCISHNYTLGAANTLNLQSSSVTDQFLGITNSILGFTSTDSSGRLTIRMQTGTGEITIPFWILSVNYNDYALAYSCINEGTDFRRVFSWKLSRTRQLSAAANTAINNVIATNVVLDSRYYNNIDHSDRACFYLPEIPMRQPVILPGQCDPNVAVVQNFNVTRYAGRWRLIESYFAEAQTGTCNDATYSLNNNVVVVYNTQVLNQQLDTITGSATVASTDGSAKLLVTFPGTPTPAEYWVLDTDYDSYALIYSCRNVNAQQRRVFSWKLSRTRDLTSTAINNINHVINNVEVLNNRFFEIIDQSDNGCFYYPAPTRNPVVFRGQCDPNVRVVTGFDAERYMTLWYDIQSYPTPFQDGTCPNAFYLLRDGGVDVFNTQVVNQRLDTITGRAVLRESTDASAKLLVTFPVAGTNLNITTDYWVLATDYTSYALVYSCTNIDDEFRQVSSWKLSRTKQLTAQATAAINAVVNIVPVLDERYYLTQDQSANGCFYYPEPQPGFPVIFPGQCDESVAVVQNFNLNQFQGVWNEIQAYPSEDETGQCISHQYTLNPTANSLNLVSSNVLNETLRVSNAVVTSVGNTGRLVLTITEGNERFEMPLWILATDYTNYALAYRCINQGTDFRAVQSWKLSRTKELSQAANTAINNVIATVQVLDNVYYENVDQTDQACFYLPDLAPGQSVVFPGQCDPNINVVQNFNPVRYMGRWRMIESYPSDFQAGGCNEANYQLLPSLTVDVMNTQVVNQNLEVVNGSAVLATTDGSAKLLVTFPNAPTASEYWILATDYDNYALVYSCANINNQQRRVWSWKLSRQRQLSANAVASINQVVNGINVLNSRYYQTIAQSDAACFYFPVPAPNTPVRFRGQCDPNIPVVTNFNLVQYLGLWHDISSYPTVFQLGTCSNALYTLNGSLVDVFNTQVVNQRLDTISGTASLVSDASNSAKIVVSFPVAGTNLTTSTDYWVLSTDYSNYALVYSCTNINDEYRSVGSWKLSRTKQLSAAANTAINNVITTIPVLDERYFVPVDQSPDGCFYFPEPQPGVPVVFPGQCDLNVQAVPNFNVNQFIGTWHEIEAYPKDEQTGQCVNHQYSMNSSTTLNLQSFNVLDEALRITNGIASVNSTDSTGRLMITLGEGPGAIEIPFWILSTDYNNYALAYSCVNRGSDFRAIYSWKLSRTKQLSAAANTAINNVIATNPVLDNRYFETIDQSDRACFYLPDLSPNEPVIFPGQCDPNISVVQNFDPVRYQGRWRMIQTYQSDFQSGTCNEANYNLLPNLTVDVMNTQVVNQVLQTENGAAVLATTDGSGKLLVTFPNAPQASEYWILDTDYNNYALVYSCSNIDNQRRRVWSWKLSRDRQLSTSAANSINQIVNSINVLNNRYYQTITHSDAACFYYPVPAPSTPVVFRGQCDQTIPVVTNFRLAEYLGLWHDIESYPSAFQDGTCSNAYYRLNGNVVDVFNTQVVNQRLDTINGVATLTSDPSNSAKIVVTFPIAGTNQTITTDYWVLSTDYSSYALVYTCINLDAERRQVASWKLSRTKQLTPTAVTLINNVINTIPVLDARYYESTDQSAEGCFYFPEPQPGVPVIFPGQCENLQAVPNFNLNQFQGIWHEIQAYPKDQQSGQCVNHQYSQGTGTTLNLQSFNVRGQTLYTSDGIVTMNSTDNSGRLLITLMDNSGLIEIPFWILSTDYTNYALAYSCVNQGQDFRAVYSWKLSRTKQLSTASNTAINNAIANIRVLDNMYYENIDQSDAACFYLPTLTPGAPVEFVGQCDPTISVVQNFDPVRYTGRWRLIETYASDFQSGACNEATYTLTPNGTVVVFNTQVINQTLDTMTGSAVLATTDNSGKLLVTFPGSPAPMEYWILGTDYDTYALVYSCSNITSERRRVWSWKLSRTRDLTAASVVNINRIVDTINVLDNRYYQRIVHTDASCFYYPTPEPGTPVVFRGQCDETIPVVMNFNIEGYMGRWYDIEGYPQNFQDGSCATATYTLTTNGVDVFNTQVVNQQLDTIIANAVPASIDGSAKLTVTFPIAGTNGTVSTPYWVLSTDYVSYALVYSCSNINNEYRRVASWKLSRQPSLTPAAVQIISNAIANIPVLEERYYVVRGHTEEDCFYYPDNNGGPVILDGVCEDQAAVTNFNTNAFGGIWYEVARFPSERQIGQCVANTFANTVQNTLTITQTIINNERLTTTIATATPSADGRGVLTTRIPDGTATIDATVYILATDYTNYALLYSCRNLANQTKQIYSWKLSRSQSGLSQAAQNSINTVVTNTRDLFEKYYDNSDQSNAACFHYPVFDQLPPAIILPGPCDQTIRAKANFNVANFAGRWNEIARYPQSSQQGQCNRPTYNPVSTGIEVINTEVINSTLNVVTGTAVASTDGSGVLEVTFTSNGAVNVATLYVLETDYSNYALTYSCRNINGSRQVHSWKLSRTLTLSNASNDQINNVIANTQGLLNEYYMTTVQSDEACFYVPEVNANEAPVFRGQCEDIVGVQGFNMQRYLGWWHEIERYPSDVSVGECISSEFRASGNQFQVVDTNIFGVTAQVNTSAVTVTNNGRLRKTLSNGQVIDIWVLATDYETYSLLYSCENINQEYRRVWSAKHSKARQLTQAAQNAMAPIIANNRVLYPQFYQTVDQSDSACFHYPEPTGRQIILPGQCDLDIPAVGNFDAAQYTGTWYQIERYPQIHETGSCTGARYTLNEDTGVVTVLNWEVIDGVLDTILGTATVNSTDGSARLRVTLPDRSSDDAEATVTTRLYVLMTDYVSYSLAYSCVDINQFQRSVGVWKLSRTRTMPAAGTTAINAFMTTRDELHQPYFVQVEHNDNCEEPSSAILVKSSIIIMLICIALQIFV